VLWQRLLPEEVGCRRLEERRHSGSGVRPQVEVKLSSPCTREERWHEEHSHGGEKDAAAFELSGSGEDEVGHGGEKARGSKEPQEHDGMRFTDEGGGTLGRGHGGALATTELGVPARGGSAPAATAPKMAATAWGQRSPMVGSRRGTDVSSPARAATRRQPDGFGGLRRCG
jgi:hypothetical protein